MNVNLQAVFAVQLSSGNPSELFPTREAAEERARIHNEAIKEAFEAGDMSLGYFTLESDLNGGCYQTCYLNIANLAGAVTEFPPLSLKAEKWSDNKGFNKIRWGNPALVRPAKVK